MVEKVFIVGEKKYDKTSKEFKVFYEDGSDAVTVGTSATTIYNVPSGKTFYLRNIIIYNSATTGNTVTIRDADTDKFQVSLSAGETKAITDVKGISFISGVVGVATVASAVVSVGGEVTEV